MNKNEQDQVLFYAFRYALGRMTYVVNDVVNLLINHKDVLTDSHKHLVQKEIKKSIEINQAGMDCDVKEWRKVLEEFEK